MWPPQPGRSSGIGTHTPPGLVARRGRRSRRVGSPTLREEGVGGAGLPFRPTQVRMAQLL